MPTLNLTLNGVNGETNDWADVETPLTQILTLINTTLLDYVNAQTNGFRQVNLRSHANPRGLRHKCHNSTGVVLVAGSIVSLSSTYSDGTDTYPLVVNAQSAAPGSAAYAMGILPDAINTGADGTFEQVYELTGLDTSAQSVGTKVYLSATPGGYTYTLPTAGNIVQLIGIVTKDHASDGRILFNLPGTVVPWSLASEI